MLNLLITGSTGMLGKRVVRAARESGHAVTAWTREDWDLRRAFEQPPVIPDRIDWIINCAGATPRALLSDSEMVLINGAAPRVLAMTGHRLLHVSTDCVYQSPGMHYVGDPPDASDPYGMSKAMGEPPSAVVVRTSFIGPEHGLQQWFTKAAFHHRSVGGWVNASWSGGTVTAVARGLMQMVERSLRPGIYHLATSEPVSKYDVLVWLQQRLRLPVTIIPKDLPVVNRALASTWKLPPLITCDPDVLHD